MSGLDYAAIAILLFMLALAVTVLWFLGGWPGRAAAARNHPYRTAVTIGGWVTLLAGGVFWPLVLIWAYAGSPDNQVEIREPGETEPAQ